jgi:cell division septum initiation protein DivIVA
MNKMQEATDVAAQLILKQAERVAYDVARAEAIVDLAIGAAVMAMASTEKTGIRELEETAKEILQVARGAAAKVLEVAKHEAEHTLRLAKSLASARLAEEDLKLAVTALISDCSERSATFIPEIKSQPTIKPIELL